ncbi:MAG: dihydroorotase [Nitrospiraceae bacterium]|nr:dihydroorotase [Nitrospiraceae bacterium]
MKALVQNGRLIDPLQGIDEICDIHIEGGRIQEVRKRGGAEARKKKNPAVRAARLPGYQVIDATGMYVVPGLIDLHVHLREPGFEHKETIKTGTGAAARGGFTSVCCMPNTRPVNDNASVTEFILSKARVEGSCSVLPIGAITKGQKGEELAEFSLMREAGCVAFSDDGRPVMDSLLMRRALEYSRVHDLPVISHCEDLALAASGVMNEGLLSVTLGLRGTPAQAEEIMVARDISLAELTGGRLHIAHVSTAGSVEIIRAAKRRGIADVTAETCPHYFSITEEAVREYDANAKVNPPLRRQSDVEAIREGLRDGVIDAIATDHAPHHRDEKEGEFDLAPSGISGLETAVGLAMRLVADGVLSMTMLVEKMAVNPARIVGNGGGTLKPGADADLVIIDPRREYRVDAGDFASKGRNTPFGGWLLPAVPVVTIWKGKVYTWE